MRGVGRCFEPDVVLGVWAVLLPLLLLLLLLLLLVLLAEALQCSPLHYNLKSLLLHTVFTFIETIFSS